MVKNSDVKRINKHRTAYKAIKIMKRYIDQTLSYLKKLVAATFEHFAQNSSILSKTNVKKLKLETIDDHRAIGLFQLKL